MKKEEKYFLVKEYKKLLDIELVELVLSGKNEAFGEIINRHQDILANTVKGMLGDCAEAEDVGQETFIRLFRSLNNFKGESELSTYLVRIGINLSLNELNKRKRLRLFNPIDFHEKEVSGIKDDNATYELNDNKELVEKALQKLDIKSRSVVVLRMIDGYSTKETAEILNLPIGTVLSRLARAQEKLRVLLKSVENEY